MRMSLDLDLPTLPYMRHGLAVYIGTDGGRGLQQCEPSDPAFGEIYKLRSGMTPVKIDWVRGRGIVRATRVAQSEGPRSTRGNTNADGCSTDNLRSGSLAFTCNDGRLLTHVVSATAILLGAAMHSRS